LLEDETHLLIADIGQGIVIADAADIFTLQKICPGRQRMQTADDIQEGSLAAARFAHDGNELPAPDFQVDTVQDRNLFPVPEIV